ncbi:MAG: hypothetical protein M1531_01610 [Chloroflexi bacterium]|nr:hypothetical protein [Chloroflexota bacterium]
MRLPGLLRGFRRWRPPSERAALNDANPLDASFPSKVGRRQFLGMALAGSLSALTIRNRAPALAPDESDFSLPSFRSLSLRTARNCVSSTGDWVRPGGPYYEMYTRDAFWITMALRDVELSNRIYRRLADRQLESGQIPTLLLRDGGREGKEDESTILYLLWTYYLWRAGVRLQSEPVYKAWQFVDRHVQRGRYVTGPGTYHYWMDTLSFGTPDVISYNQGLYAVAARCVQKMGVEPSLLKVSNAEKQYRALYSPEWQTVTLSEKSNLIDVSCLTGEYMAYHLTGQPILSDDHVQSTLSYFATATYPEGDFLGYRVTSQPVGDYLDPAWLPASTDNLPGEYQNGGSWLLYDALALGVAALHNDPTARGLLLARIRSEVRTDRSLHEYLSTNPVSPYFGVGPAYRRDYGWNAFVYLVSERLNLTDEEPVSL